MGHGDDPEETTGFHGFHDDRFDTPDVPAPRPEALRESSSAVDRTMSQATCAVAVATDTYFLPLNGATPPLVRRHRSDPSSMGTGREGAAA